MPDRRVTLPQARAQLINDFPIQLLSVDRVSKLVTEYTFYSR
jgi:hypothetical protein